LSGLRIRHPGAWIGAGLFIVGLFFLTIVFRVFESGNPHNKSHPDYAYDEQTFDDQGREHIAAGQVVEGYNSDPPTSGPHGPAAAWGVHEDPVRKESAVHNMEHGGVVVWYNCAAGRPLLAAQCTALRDQLAAIVSPAADRGLYVLMTPYADMEHRIALTAWRTLDSFDAFDGARVQAFIASFECRFDPERACR